MNYPIPALDVINRQLTTVTRPHKPKMLVVDDEPDNLDLLYRTFRRDFSVLKAESGMQALQLLSQEGEVAVIISDQRMPEMKGTEFLSRTLPEFPDTMRIILTGFTDVEDLVDAINSGQVYRYITKPWDPNELKEVVQRATETYALLKQRTEELCRAQAQTALLASIVQAAQTAQSIDECLEPIALAFGENFNADQCVLQLVEASQLGASYGTYGVGPESLQTDALVLAALQEQKMQASQDVSADESLAAGQGDMKAVVAVPVLHRDRVLAVLALKWKQPTLLREDELVLCHLSAQQVALALCCVCSK
jgi:CheY-like chemotaxis protein